MRIDKFTKEFRFLSNFWACRIELDGKVYASVEEAYQAAKTILKEEREGIRLAGTPGKAKRLGRKVTLRSDWEAVKVDIMRGFLQQKFKEGSSLHLMLRQTGDSELIEGNSWGDTFWGMCQGKGENRLGKLLMEIRG